MNILYLLTILPPKMPEAEALSQEITALRSCFEGELLYLNPNQHVPIYVPRFLFGFHQLKDLRTKEVGLDLHHLYNPDPFPFPILHRLQRPVVYTISSGVGNKHPNVTFFKSLAAVAVADERSLKRLNSWGVDNSVLVRPGIDTSRFTYSPLPLQSEIKLMVGSAPWTKGQFRTKGVDALLAAARQASHLHLIFLWRGILADEIMQRVRRLNLEKQVTVLNKQVEVNQVLANVHASIVLASDSGIIKSYPHSLLDSLAAGKPVLVSRSIPMADYVEQTGCGKVVKRVTPSDILTAVEALVREYGPLQKSAQQVGQRDFSQQQMLASYQKIYERVLALNNHREQ
jgi:glycosyltransferase involved in cell wall biosynthesis